MPITRTAMIDDDGSGTTGTIFNNAWKTELYNQIDALIGIPQTAWTPNDISGANLAIAIAGATYIRLGNLVSIQLQFNYPINSDGSNSAISLPFFCIGAGGGFAATGGVMRQYAIGSGSNALRLVDMNGQYLTNAQLSGQGVACAGVYQTTP